MSASRARVAAVAFALSLAAAGIARADAPASAHAGSPIAEALDRFDFGDYDGVIGLLGPLVENGARELARVDRMEALRTYGIACVLASRRVAAEGAFLLLLREEPSTRLDPRLVRPEAVAFFEDVRARHRAELLELYRKTRPRYHWALDLIPVAGQFQNRQPTKAFVLGGVELGLLGGYVASYVLLNRYSGSDGTFTGHTSVYDVAKPMQYVCYVSLFAVTAAGIVDAFVVGARRARAERQTEARLGY